MSVKRIGVIADEMKTGLERMVTAIANTAAVDLADEIVVPSGAEVDEQGRPRYFADAKAIYWNHNYISGDGIPIGKLRKAQLVKTPKGEAWRAVFYVSDKTELARDIFSLIGEGIINGVSIGFEADDFGPLTKDETAQYGPAKSIIRRWRWRELSVTAMPCNPQAWIEGVKGAALLGEERSERVRKLAMDGVIGVKTAEMMGLQPRRTLVIV